MGNQARKKSLDESSLLEVMRSRKLSLLSSAAAQLLPHVSVLPPRTAVCSSVVPVLSVLAAVQDAPLSQESSTLVLLLPMVLSSHQSRRISMPLTEHPEGMEML